MSCLWEGGKRTSWMKVASELTDVGMDRFVSRKEPHRVKEKVADGGTRDPVPAGGMSGLWELEEVVVTLECLEPFEPERIKWTGGNEPRLPHTEKWWTRRIGPSRGEDVVEEECNGQLAEEMGNEGSTSEQHRPSTRAVACRLAGVAWGEMCLANLEEAAHRVQCGALDGSSLQVDGGVRLAARF